MPWVEGIGDEVLITFSVLTGLCIIIAAWFSTGIRDIPFISVIIVQLTRRRVLNRPAEGENVSVSGQENNIPSSNTQENTAIAEENTQEVTGTAPAEPINETHLHPENVRADSVRDAEASVGDTPLNETGVCQTVIDEERNVDVEGDDACSGDSGEDSDTPCNEEELRKRRVNFFTESVPTHSDKDNEPLTGSSGSNQKVKDSEKKANVENSPTPKTLTQLASNLLSEGLRHSVPVNTEQESQTKVGSSEETPVQETTHDTESEQLITEELPLSEGHIRVRIKFLNDTQKLVTCLPTETIGNFRRAHFSQELSQSKLVRFIFNGKDLRNEAATLQSYNVGDNSVLHCLITSPRNNEQQQQQQQQPNHGDEDALDIGVFMYPLFALLLGLVWYTRFMYRQFFNVTSTLTLGGITFLYLAALMSTLRGRHTHEHLE